MKISKQEIEQIAHLARLTLEEDELKHFAKSINDIVGYVSSLQTVKIDSVVAANKVLDAESVLRADTPEQYPLVAWRKNLPRKQDQFIEVEAMFDHENR